MRKPQTLAKRQERRLAKRVNGKRQPGSGNLRYAKEDVQTAPVLYQCKTTSKHSMSIKKKDLQMLLEHATNINKIPYMELEFRGSQLWDNIKWYVIPQYIFDKYIDIK